MIDNKFHRFEIQLDGQILIFVEILDRLIRLTDAELRISLFDNFLLIILSRVELNIFEFSFFSVANID
jgi:hypothetical protein